MAAADFLVADAGEYYGQSTLKFNLEEILETELSSGDIVFFEFLTDDGSRNLNSSPANSQKLAEHRTTTAPSSAFWLYSKKLGGSEPATQDFSFNYAFNGRVGISVYRGGSEVSVVGVLKVNGPSISSPYAPEANAVSVPDDDTRLAWFGALRVSTSGVSPAATEPSGFTERYDSGADYDPRWIGLADKTQASAGSSGAANGSVTRAGAGNAHAFGVLVAISPAAGATTMPASGSPELPVIASISREPPSLELLAGSVGNVAFTPRDQFGNGLPHLEPDVASSGEGVATADLSGPSGANGQAAAVVTAVGAGAAQITASLDGVESPPVAVTVVAPASSIVVTPSGLSMVVNGMQQFAAQIVGGDAASFTWSVSAGGGTINSSGVYTAPGTPGVATIRASLTSEPTVFGEVQVTITALPAGAIAVSSTWTFGGVPFANNALDYIVKSASNEVIVNGSGVTNGSGVLTVLVPASYSGQKVLIHVENVGPDMITTGKVHQAQVVTVP